MKNDGEGRWEIYLQICIYRERDKERGRRGEGEGF